MIPKIIHYCWFGRTPLPESAVRCIESWKKFIPSYQIKEWNEDNFDVNIIPYTKEAYAAKKYAFVSDFARFWVIYHYGGIYFDVDVEVVKPMDDILSKGPFWGIEINNNTNPLINPGLGIAAPAQDELYKAILDKYQTMKFYSEDGAISKFTMIPMVSEFFCNLGLKGGGDVECISGHYIYPQEYFNPLNDATGRLTITENTRSIHWYMKSWISEPRWKVVCKRFIRRCIGAKGMKVLRKLFL